MADPDYASTLKAMLRSRDRETKQLVTLATKLRLTNQSRYTPHAADAAGRNDLRPGPRPWQTDETHEERTKREFDEYIAEAKATGQS